MRYLFNGFILSALLLTASLLPAQAPELSADEPIAYTADNGILIATGNAIYTDEDSRIEADGIRYNRISNKIEASGNVRVTREGIRLLTDSLVYDTESKLITAGRFRAGYPPLFIEGESFTGTLDEIDFSNVSLYFREPVQNSPRVDVKSGKWISGESISGDGLKLNTLGGLSIPLPRFQYAFGSPTADFDVNLGFRNSLGAYARTKWLYPFSQNLSLGANLDAFSRRGILIGPALEWKAGDGTIEFLLDTGWIHDHDSAERGVDLLQERIEQGRGFAHLGINANQHDGRIQLQARSTYISDSEFYRDFRRNEYFENVQPDSFVDFTYQEGNALINVFARREVSGFYGMVERLPQLTAEWLPSEVGETGIYLQANAGAVRYRLVEIADLPLSISFPQGPLGLDILLPPVGTGLPELIKNPYHDRLDGSFTLTKPMQGPAGTQIVLRAGGRWSQYRRNETGTLSSLTEDRWIGELGADISRSLVRTYSFNRPEWNIDRLRHITRLSMQYRWHPGGGDSSPAIPGYDSYVYHARRPALDLSDLTHTDSLREWSVARLSWENTILVADEDQPFRDYLSVNLFQDIDFSADPGLDEWDALYAEIDFQPFPWLDLQWRQKFRTEQKETEAGYLRATVRSADLWSATLQAEYLRGGLEQYDLTARYRLTENLGLLGYWHYDSRLDTLTRQQYGFSRRFGNVWQVEMYVAFNNENDREDDFSVGMRWAWLAF